MRDVRHDLARHGGEDDAIREVLDCADDGRAGSNIDGANRAEDRDPGEAAP